MKVSVWEIYILDALEGSSRLLIEDGFNARYAPSGHIVFIRDGSLWAVPFDVDTLEIVGEEVPVVTGIETWADAVCLTTLFLIMVVWFIFQVNN